MSRGLPRWLLPGMRIKRWLFFVFLGIVALGLAGAVLLLDLYRTQELAEDPIFYWLTGVWLERTVRAAVLIGLGVLLLGIGMWGLMRSILSPFVVRGDSVLELLYTKRYLARGPRVVAIGGRRIAVQAPRQRDSCGRPLAQGLRVLHRCSGCSCWTKTGPKTYLPLTDHSAG
jgi:hypothetical protein